MASARSTRTAGPSRTTRCAVVTCGSLLGARRLLRRQDRPAARRSAALADVELLPLFILGAIPLVRVVVRQLVAFGDVADSLDVDALLVVDRFAVRRATVVDETRVVAADGGVDHHRPADAEQEGVMTPHAGIVIPLVGFLMGDAFSDVLDDARAFLDRPSGEGATSLDLRAAQLEILVGL